MNLIIGDEYILDSNVPAGWHQFGRGRIKATLVSITTGVFHRYYFSTPYGRESFNSSTIATWPALIVKHLPINLENV